jgi:radical SAM protein with 4Fe4S-binding SPASM domain
MSTGDGPSWLIWIITASCNLNCPYCYSTHYLRERPLGREEVMKLLREAASTGVRYIDYTGGEPLMRRDISEILEETVDLGINASIFTNLTLLSQDIASKISKLDIGVVTSLDGPREIYERVKGQGTWEKFLRGIDELKRRNIPFHVNITVSTVNYERVGDAIILANDLGADSISIIPSMAFGRALETKSFIGREEFLKSVIQADRVAEEIGIRVSVWCSPFLGVLKLRNLYYSDCREFRELDVSPGGKALVCDVMGVEVADITKDGIRGAWRKLNESELYLRVKELPIECSDCRICRGGCYARAFNYWGRLPSIDPLCPRAPLTKLPPRT